MTARLAALVGTLLFPLASWAYTFEPSDFEWAGWPEFCRARYVTTQVGGTTKWARQYSQVAIERSRSGIGEQSFLHVHHYCAGLAWLSRARLAPEKKQKGSLLDQANEEVSYTFARIPPTSPIYSQVAVTLAQVYEQLGRSKEGIELLQKTLEERPGDARGYLGLAMLYRGSKDLERARDTLLAGDKAVEQRSIEIHYSLGLIYFELGDMDGALEYGRKAYAKNYPLPGLQQKLRQAGVWHD
jgi:tetratricopeptide (TPR) repeat protein